MDKLIEGYREFRRSRWPEERAHYEELSKGQRPEFLVIACSDSRADPATIFSARPGELFVIRNVANLIPPYSPDSSYHGVSSALEYAVTVLQVQHIVVLGHARCGGVRAFADDEAAGEFIGRWMSLVTPAAERLGPPGDDLTAYLPRLERAAVENSLANLMTFPCVRTLVERGRLNLHGAFFGIATGGLLVRDPDTGAFEPAVPGVLPGRRSTLRAVEV